MPRKYTLGDNPLRGWFRMGRYIIRVLQWTNYEPTETGYLPPREWIIKRRSDQLGMHLKYLERFRLIDKVKIAAGFPCFSE